jgi:hypothetical protein
MSIPSSVTTPAWLVKWVRPAAMCLLVAIAAILTPARRLDAESEPAAAGGFAAQVEAHFAEWDLDHDGVLSFRELGELVPDVRIRDEAAAALAAIHRVQRSRAWHHAAFSFEEILAPPDEAGEGHRPPFARDYRGGLTHIRATARALFTTSGPNLRGIRQGPLGDCVLLATVGAMVARDPNQLRAMIVSAPGGGFEVRFFGGAPVYVPAISDAEIALGSGDRDQGLWLNVIEKAFGEIVVARRGFVEPAIDALSGTAAPAQTIRLFTGREGHALRLRPREQQGAPHAALVRRLMAQARAVLNAAQRQRRLICCSTTHAEMPPGISGNHMYAVLGFDRSSELVRVWNPHGNTFTPKGPPGLEAGYVVQNGVFEVPLAEFVQIFSSLTYESDRPAAVVELGSRTFSSGEQ